MEIIIKYTGFNIVLRLLEKIQNKELRSFVAFFFTAVLGAGTNFVSQIPYKWMLLDFGMENKEALNWSVFLGYLTATVVSFIPQKIFAFSAKESGNTRRETIKYLIIALTALGIQVGVTSLSFDYITNPILSQFSLFIREKVAHVIGMGCSFFANFYGHKMLTFRSTGIYDKVKARTKKEKVES